MSIRVKLTIMFLAIAALPLIFVSALTFTNYKKTLEANRISSLQDITAFKADTIEAYFAGLKTNIQVAQSYYNIKKNLPILLHFIDEPNNPEAIECKEILDMQLSQMRSVLKDVSDIMLVSPQGRVVYANKPLHYYKDISKAPTEAERNALEAGKYGITLSDVYFDKAEDNRYEMLVTAPAYDLNGVTIGVIALEVDMTGIYQLIADNTGLGKTGESVIGKKIDNEVLYLNPLKFEPNTALVRRVPIGTKVAIPIQNAVQGKTGAAVTVDYRGTSVIGAWRYLPSLDWGLATKIDTSEAFADVTNLRNLAIAILFIVIVISAIMAFSIAHSISEPIKRLSDGAAIVGSGNLDYKIGTNQKDEIGQLSRTFDKMTSNLRQTLASRDELNREIAERKRAQDELQIIIDSVPAMIFYKDKENHFVRVNKAFEEAMGRPKDKLEGWSLFDLYPEEQARAFWEDDKEVMANGRPKLGIVEPMQSPKGTRIVQTAKIPYFDESGNVIGVIGFSVDITEKKKAEDEINRHIGELTRFNQLMVGREVRMVDLKKEVNELCEKTGQQKRYDVGFLKEQG